MQCPKCGYMMSDFDKECPRCIALSKVTPPQPAPQVPPLAQLPPPQVVMPPKQVFVQQTAPQLSFWQTAGAFAVALTGCGCVLPTLLFFAVVVRGCGPNVPPESRKPTAVEKLPSDAPIRLTVEEYQRAYEDNEIAADHNYKDKTIHLTGVVQSFTSRDDALTLHLQSRGGRMLLFPCGFSLDHRAQLASLRKGQAVVVEGTGGWQLFTGPVLHNCRLVAAQ